MGVKTCRIMLGDCVAQHASAGLDDVSYLLHDSTCSKSQPDAYAKVYYSVPVDSDHTLCKIVTQLIYDIGRYLHRSWSPCAASRQP